MKSAAHFTCLAVMVGATACSMGELNVRPIKSTLAEGRQPSNVRVAEGNAQLALNNVALAIEAYRKALREEPNNVEAMIGLASCYDRMGRADISRRHYEMALAVDPANTEVYSHFAQSLDAQGQRDEAARVKAELAERVVAPEAPREVPGSVPVLPPPPAQSVTVALAPPRSVPVAVERPIGGGMRLERLSMREVALVTKPTLEWEAKTVARTATATTIKRTFHIAVLKPSSAVAMNFPATISVRPAGLMSSVSMVPRSFSPAVMSMAG